MATVPFLPRRDYTGQSFYVNPVGPYTYGLRRDLRAFSTLSGEEEK
jgi:hypothetical protein